MAHGQLPAAFVIPLTNFNDVSYYGALCVGNPLVEFPVSFDTNASEVWIPSSHLDEDFDHDTYVAAASHTYNPNPGTPVGLTVRHGNGNIELYATRRTEAFGFPGVQGIIRNQFCAIYHARPIDYYNDVGWTGIVGLSFPPPAAIYAPPLWRNLMDAGILHHNIFSVWMRYFAVSGVDGGEICFGAADPHHYNIDEGHEFFDVVEGYNKWIIQMSYVVVGQNREIQHGKALINTASPYIYGPPRIIQTINSQILGRQVPATGRIELGNDDLERFEEMPDVSFTFFGSERIYSLTSVEYIMPDVENPGHHTTVFRPMQFQQRNAEYFTLGMPFLRRYHSIFNFEDNTIGFAPSTP